MNFDDQDISRLLLLRTAAKNFRALEAEARLAAESLPRLLRAAADALAVLDRLLPSQVIAFGPDVAAAWQAHQRAEFSLRAMKASSVVVESKLAGLKSDLTRALDEFFTPFRSKVAKSFSDAGGGDRVPTSFGYVTPACVAELDRIEIARKGTITEQADALIALAVSLGVQLPEGEL